MNLVKLEIGDIASCNDRVLFRGEYTRVVGLNGYVVKEGDEIYRFRPDSTKKG